MAVITLSVIRAAIPPDKSASGRRSCPDDGSTGTWAAHVKLLGNAATRGSVRVLRGNDLVLSDNIGSAALSGFGFGASFREAHFSALDRITLELGRVQVQETC